MGVEIRSDNNAGLWAFGLWALGFGLWTLDFGLWALGLGFGLWALDFGLWALGFGLRAGASAVIKDLRPKDPRPKT